MSPLLPGKHHRQQKSYPSPLSIVRIASGITIGTHALLFAVQIINVLRDTPRLPPPNRFSGYNFVKDGLCVMAMNNDCDDDIDDDNNDDEDDDNYDDIDDEDGGGIDNDDRNNGKYTTPPSPSPPKKEEITKKMNSVSFSLVIPPLKVLDVPRIVDHSVVVPHFHSRGTLVTNATVTILRSVMEKVTMIKTVV